MCLQGKGWIRCAIASMCLCTTCAVTREYMWMQLTDSEIDRNHCRLLFVISHKLFSMAFSVRWKKIFLFIFFFAFKYSCFCYLSFWINRGKFVCNNFCVYLNWKNNGTRLRLRIVRSLPAFPDLRRQYTRPLNWLIVHQQTGFRNKYGIIPLFW